jgi:hypothetical protein
MAKSSGKTGGTSRIRFIMFDADIPDGEIQSVTQAISNALRGPSPVVKRIAAPVPPMNGHAEQSTEPEVMDEAEEEVEAVDVTPAATKKKAQRRVAAKPNVIPLDIESDPPLSSLGQFSSNLKRYLAIAAWLHDHRNITVIDEDHIYTCYRHLGWPTDIPDFAQPLRSLKHKQYFESPESGKYAINQLGLQKAKAASGD